jgi:NADPH2:quinone reductase
MSEGASSTAPTAVAVDDSKMMWAVRLHGKVEGSIRTFTREELEAKVKLERIPIPVPRSGQVLIKVAKSGLLPMNMSELKKSYGTPDSGHSAANVEPQQCGSEGCGVVVSSGGGLLAWRLVGKRVAFFRYNSAWAEYACVSYAQCIELPAALPWFKATSAFANPFTALAFLEIAEAAGCKTIVHTAGASTLGLMLIKHGKRVGVNVIAVVHRDAQVDTCLQAGALAALNSNADDFVDRLRALAAQHNAMIAFDAVAGELTGTVLSALPNKAKLHVYGGLSEQRPVIGTRDLIFKGKAVEGFWLKDYAATKWSVGLLQWSMIVAAQLDGDFASPVGASFKLAQVHDAILAYPKTTGKVVLICDSTLDESA